MQDLYAQDLDGRADPGKFERTHIGKSVSLELTRRVGDSTAAARDAYVRSGKDRRERCAHIGR